MQKRNYHKFALFIVFLLQLSCALPLATIKDVANTPLPTVSDTPTGLPTLANTPLPTVLVTAIQSLNVRQRAGEHERVIGALYHDDWVTLTGNCANAWAEIVWKDGTAWVNASYLSENKCSK